MSAQAQSASSPSMGGAMRPMNPGATMPGHGFDAMHKSMMGGMEKMQQMRPTGDIDKDFAMMMKMHHQQAIEMAKPQIEHGKSAEMKTFGAQDRQGSDERDCSARRLDQEAPVGVDALALTLRAAAARGRTDG